MGPKVSRIEFHALYTILFHIIHEGHSMQHGGGDTVAGSVAQLQFSNCYATIDEPISLANRAIYSLGT